MTPWKEVLTRLFENGVAEIDPATKKPVAKDAHRASFFAQYRTADGMSSMASIDIVNEDFESFIRDTNPVIITGSRALVKEDGSLIKKVTRGGLVQNSRIGETLFLLYHTNEDRDDAENQLIELFPELMEENRIIRGEDAVESCPQLEEMLDIPNVSIPSRIGTPARVKLDQMLILTVPANPQGLYSFIRRENRRSNVLPQTTVETAQKEVGF